MTVDMLDLSTKLGAVAAESNKRLEELALRAMLVTVSRNRCGLLSVSPSKPYMSLSIKLGLSWWAVFVSGWKVHMLAVGWPVFIR